MSDIRIRQALEKHLKALTPALPTALENVLFTPPNSGAYQETFLLPAPNKTLGLRQRTTTHRGIFQVNLCYPSGKGAGDAGARAKLLQEHFDPASTLLSQDGVNVRIEGKPSIGGPLPGTTGLYVLPVSIRYQSTF